MVDQAIQKKKKNKKTLLVQVCDILRGNYQTEFPLNFSQTVNRKSVINVHRDTGGNCCLVWSVFVTEVNLNN